PGRGCGMANSIFGTIAVDQVGDALVFVVAAKRGATRYETTAIRAAKVRGELKKRSFFARNQSLDSQRIGRFVFGRGAARQFSIGVDELDRDSRMRPVPPHSAVH